MNIALPIIAIALIAGAFVGGYRFAQWRAVPEYPLYRGAAIRQQAGMIPAGGVLFIGDSIVEQGYTPTLCGLPVLNAGISGATVEDLMPMARDAINLAKPSRVLISVGLNNALPKSKRVSIDSYGQQLDEMVAAAMAANAQVSLLTQTAVRQDAALEIDLAKLKEIDTVIRQLAQHRQVQLIEISGALAGPDGQMAPALTIDGVHLTATGYAVWNDKITQEACRP